MAHRVYITDQEQIVRTVPDVSEFVADWGYLAIFVIVILGNVGLPVPEESALLAGGYLVWRGDLMWSGVLTVGIVSAVVAIPSCGEPIRGQRPAEPPVCVLRPWRLVPACFPVQRLAGACSVGKPASIHSCFPPV